MTNNQIKKLLELALKQSNTDGPCYDVGKLVIQIQLIIGMLEDEPKPYSNTRDFGKDIGDIK